MLKSIAVIPDGNRRYAKEKKIPLEKVYEKSINKLLDIVEWSADESIETVILWGFSTENWNRSEKEKKTLFSLFEIYSEKFLSDKRVDDLEVKIMILGDINKFPKRLSELFKKIENRTAKNKKIKLNVLLNYGGREELIMAVNKVISSGKKKLSEQSFKKYLWLADEPDLIIRTSGEKRLSGLLPFQSVYSELYFEKKYFPEFSKKDFKKAIEDFKNRKRRYGK